MSQPLVQATAAIAIKADASEGESSKRHLAEPSLESPPSQPQQPLQEPARAPDGAVEPFWNHTGLSPRRKKKKKGRIYRCTGFPGCSMTFTRSEHLARHIRKHTGERPFKCEHCHKRFSRLDNLRQHKQTVHMYERFILTYPGQKVSVRIKNKGGAEDPAAAAAASAAIRMPLARGGHIVSSVASAPITPAAATYISPPPSASHSSSVSQPEGSLLPPPRRANLLASAGSAFRPHSGRKPGPIAIPNGAVADNSGPTTAPVNSTLASAVPPAFSQLPVSSSAMPATMPMVLTPQSGVYNGTPSYYPLTCGSSVTSPVTATSQGFYSNPSSPYATSFFGNSFYVNSPSAAYFQPGYPGFAQPLSATQQTFPLPISQPPSATQSAFDTSYYAPPYLSQLRQVQVAEPEPAPTQQQAKAGDATAATTPEVGQGVPGVETVQGGTKRWLKNVLNE